MNQDTENVRLRKATNKRGNDYQYQLMKLGILTENRGKGTKSEIHEIGLDLIKEKYQLDN